MDGVTTMMQFGKQCVQSLESGVAATNLAVRDKSVLKKVGPVPSDWESHGMCTPSGMCGASFASKAASECPNWDEGSSASWRLCASWVAPAIII